MTLETYQDTVLALIQGRANADATARLLFGVDDERTVARLQGYRDSHVLGVAEGLEIQHPQTWRTIEARLGREAWVRIVTDFLAEHPLSHPHRVVALAPFAAFLAARPELPAWLADLARLERASLLADLAPDEAGSAVTLPSAVQELAYDVLTWSEAGPDVHADPEARPCIVLTWRGADEIPLQAEVGRLEALVVEALRRGVPPEPDELAALEVDEAEFEESRAALGEIGAVRT